MGLVALAVILAIYILLDGLEQGRWKAPDTHNHTPDRRDGAS